MTRLPFTPGGFADMQAALYKLDDAALLEAALSLSDDFLSWTARHFELEVSLLEDLRSLPEVLLRQLGWSMASCVIGRNTFVLEESLPSASNIASFQLLFSASFNCRTGAHPATDERCILICTRDG